MEIHQGLGHLLQGVDGIPFGPIGERMVTGISIDSREVEPGHLFVAMKGQHADGAAFLQEAVFRGAAGAVLPLGAALPEGLAGIQTARPRDLLPRLSARFYGRPADDLHIVGVTGTNGKSTFIHMIQQILEAGGKPAGYWSTPEVHSGLRRFRPKLTTPEAPDLQRFFAEVREAGMNHACIEVSSHAMVMQRTGGVPFAIGAVTNITGDHLDFHPTFDDYVAAKRSFVESLGPGGICLLNADDSLVRQMDSAAKGRVVTYGFSPGAHLQARDPLFSPSATSFVVRIQAPFPLLPTPLPSTFPVRIPLPGRHNIQNALAAIGAALASGVSLETMQRALRTFRPPARRLEQTRIGEYTVISDVAMNEASYDAVFESLASLHFAQVVVVHAIRGNRGPAVNGRIAVVLARWNRALDFAPLIVSLSRRHVARYAVDYQVRPEEQNAFTETARREGLSISLHEELTDAVAEGVARLHPGGLLLLLGTFGMDDGAAIAESLLRQRYGAGRASG